MSGDAHFDRDDPFAAPAQENPYSAPSSSSRARAYEKELDHKLADRGVRLLAALIDGFCYVAILLVGGITAMATSAGTGSEAGLVLVFLVTGVALLSLTAYQWYLISTSGETIGKRGMRIRIVTIDTLEPPGFVRGVLLRGLVNALLASIIPLYGLVDVLFIFAEDRRCLHDKIAATTVIAR